MNQREFEALIEDTTKRISGDISWDEDEDHSPAVEFRVEVTSQIGYTLFIKGRYHPVAQKLTYALIHHSLGRIYALDMGKEHRNPSGENVGEKHKHRWNKALRDKEAYVPEDITALLTDPVGVWQQFCIQLRITHNGVMHSPPLLQTELF
jgi:hypothetical protein